MTNSIGYHTRLYGNNTVKVCGGSFGGAIDAETINRLVKHHFTVVANASGTLVFVDREGREVSLYVTIDPATTEAGKVVAQAYRAEKEAERERQEHKRRKLNDAIEEALDHLTVDEVIKILQVGKQVSE